MRRASLTSPYWDVSALGLHHDGGHGHGDRDGIEVGGVWCQGEDGCLGGQGLPPLHGHPVEAADEPHGPHDGLEQEVHDPMREDANQTGVSFLLWTVVDILELDKLTRRAQGLTQPRSGRGRHSQQKQEGAHRG